LSPNDHAMKHDGQDNKIHHWLKDWSDGWVRTLKHTKST